MVTPVAAYRSAIDFITDSFHFQQGKTEMDPALLKGHGFASFNTSPGMFGKYSILPNRQLTPASVARPEDVALTQPEWLTKCGNFSYNRQAFNADGTVKAEVLDLSDPPLETCAQCHGFSARRADLIQPIQHADILRGAEKAGWVYNGSKITFRGIKGDIVDPEAEVTGFKPAYVATPARDGHLEIRPTNLITGLSWFDQAKGRPVYTWQMQKAFFLDRKAGAGWEYRPEILSTFADIDRSGPEPAFDNRALLRSFYLIGNSRVAWVEILGWLAVVGALLFTFIHGFIRLLGASK